MKDPDEILRTNEGFDTDSKKLPWWDAAVTLSVCFIFAVAFIFTAGLVVFAVLKAFGVGS